MMFQFAGTAHTFFRGNRHDAETPSEEKQVRRQDGRLGSYWTHEGSLHYATSLRTGGNKQEIRIREFRPTPPASHPVVESFHVPYHDGEFSFSPVSSHASFVTETAVIILDVRNGNTLLHTKPAQPSYQYSSGLFSPNGCFFACEILKSAISVWKNTPDGYIPWSTIRTRLLCSGFSFSPTTTSIIAWGTEGIQLLRSDSCSSPLIPNTADPRPAVDGNLVTSSIDGTWIAVAPRGGPVITIIDSLSGSPQHHLGVG